MMNGPHASIWSLAHSGDTARQIAFGDQYENLRKLFGKKSLQIDAFLFSAGGNDIAGNNLVPILKEYQTGYTWRDCIDQAYLELKWMDLREAYERIIELRDELRPGLPIFTHSYDFAAPTGAKVHLLWLPIAGGWLKEKFELKGIGDYKMQLAILTHLLEKFAELLDELEGEHADFVHIRTQGTLKKDEWGDELHPSMSGYKKIAAKFQDALRQRFPSLPSPG